MASEPSVFQQDAIYCLERLREQSPDLYLASLLLPEKLRAPVVALHAFHSEITGITLAAPEPLAGEVRLQWWIDVLKRIRDDEARQNPLARTLLAVIDDHNLSAEALVKKVEAHVFDLYSDPMGDTTTLEAYLGETRSVMFQLAAMIADPDAAREASDASGHAGVATGCVAIIENLARHRAQQRVFVPSDILENSGTSAERLLTNTHEAEISAVRGLISVAWGHYQRAQQAFHDVSGDIRPVFAPLALVPLYLKRAQKQPQKTLTGLPPISQLRRQWTLWRA